MYFLKPILVQSAGTVEYTDCISAKGYDPLQSVSRI